MLKNIEKLWLCYAFGFGTKAIYGHICLYVATYMYIYFFGHPQGAASIRLDDVFYPLRLFLINDQKTVLYGI